MAEPEDVYHFTVGSVDCRVVTDGRAAYNPLFAFPGFSADELAETMKQQGDGKGNVLLPYNPMLIRVGKALVLLDTGLGALARETGDPAGQLQASLTAAGVAPADVDMVIISHAHPDHIGGLTRLTENGQIPVFERARHYMSKLEWDFWTSENSLAGLPEFLAGPARVHLPALRAAGVVELVSEETDIVPGVSLFPAPGHTPGHMGVAIRDGGVSALCVGDAFGHELHVKRLDAVTPVDIDPSSTVETRKDLLARAEREESIVMAYHFRSPGRVQRFADGYAWFPGGPEESLRAMRAASSLRDRMSSLR